MPVEASFLTVAQAGYVVLLNRAFIQMLHRKGNRPNAQQEPYATWHNLGNGLIAVIEEEIQLKQVKFPASSALHLHMDLFLSQEHCNNKQRD